MIPPIITLTTDFGAESSYVAAMKGVIFSLAPLARIIDLSHSIAPQDIQAGAYFWEEATRYFPPQAIHIGVVDPGVGTERRLILLEGPSGKFLAPDNGLAGWLADRVPQLKIWQVVNPKLWRAEVSATFHGRDILAPVAAHLSLGRSAAEVGPLVTDLVQLAAKKGRRVAQRIDGEVIEIDPFGNLITNITSDMLDGVPTDETCRIECEEHETVGIYRTYADQPAMTFIALVGSNERLELAIVSDSAAMMLGVKKGAKISVKW